MTDPRLFFPYCIRIWSFLEDRDGREDDSLRSTDEDGDDPNGDKKKDDSIFLVTEGNQGLADVLGKNILSRPYKQL